MQPTDITITAFDNNIKFDDRVSKGGARTYKIDFGPWAENNNAVTGVTWEIKSGQATISNETLATNIATALISFSEAGKQLIKVTATTGTQTYIVWIQVKVIDPSFQYLGDYAY